MLDTVTWRSGIVTVALLAGCTSPTGPPPEAGPAGPATDAELRACPPGADNSGDRNSFEGELIPQPGQTYVVAQRLTVTGPAETESRYPKSRVDLTSVSSVYGTATPTNGLMLTRGADLVAAATAGGSRLLLKAYVPERGAAFLSPVAVLRPGGRFVFMLFCEEGDQVVANLAAHGVSTSRTATEVLLSAIRDPAGPEADVVLDPTRPVAALPWEKRPPRERDYGDAPAAVKKLLHEILVEVIVPAQWRDFPDVVAMRTPVARGHGAVALGAFSDSAAAHAQIGTTVQDGQPLLVVLTDGGFVDLGILASVPERVWRPALGRTNKLVLRSDPALVDRSDLLARLATGRPVLTADPR